MLSGGHTMRLPAPALSDTGIAETHHSPSEGKKPMSRKTRRLDLLLAGNTAKAFRLEARRRGIEPEKLMVMIVTAVVAGGSFDALLGADARDRAIP